MIHIAYSDTRSATRSALRWTTLACGILLYGHALGSFLLSKLSEVEEKGAEAALRLLQQGVSVDLLLEY